MAFWGPCSGCGAQGTHPSEASSATSSMARVMLGRLTMCKRILEFHRGPVSSWPFPKPPTHLQNSPESRANLSSFHFPNLLLLAWSSFTEASVHMSYLELSWSKRSLSLMSKAWEWREAELFRTTLVLASIGTKGHHVRALLTAPALLISEKSLCFRCV